MYSNEDVEIKLKFNRENLPDLRSEAVFVLRVFAEKNGSSTSLCRAEVDGLSQGVASNGFWCSKSLDFLVNDLVRGEGGIGNGDESTSDGSGI